MTIKNADMPAMPINDRYKMEVNGKPMSGLTKQEHFAGLAMQSLIKTDRDRSETNIAKLSIGMADSLLEELENQNDS